MAGERGERPQQADHGPSGGEGKGGAAGLGHGQVRAQRSGDLARVAELGDGRLGGGPGWQARAAARFYGVKETAAQLGQDVIACPPRAGQARGDHAEVGLDPRRAGHGVTGRGTGASSAVTAAENSRQVPRSSASARRPAVVSS